MNWQQARCWRVVLSVGLGLAALLLAFRAVLAGVPNLAALYWRDVSLPAPARPAVTQLAAHRHAFRATGRFVPPSGRTAVDMLWFSTRLARQLEGRWEESAEVGCAWDPGACEQVGRNTRLSPRGHAQIATAFVQGQLEGHTPLDRELIVYSCLKVLESPGVTQAGEICLERLGARWPEMSPLATRSGLYVARHVPELTALNSVTLGQLLDQEKLTCEEALGFLRDWVRGDGFIPAQLESAGMAAAGCPDSAETQLYYARAADLASQRDQARTAYATVGPAVHPEAAFWQIDFLARSGDCAGAVANSQAYLQTWPDGEQGLRLSSALRACCADHGGCPESVTAEICASQPMVFEAEDLLSRFAESEVIVEDNFYPDADASEGLARRSQRVHTFVAYGPYISLPYGRYRVTFYLKAEGSGAWAIYPDLVARLDVRVDYTDWRTHFWSSRVFKSQAVSDDYQMLAHEFTHSGEGYVSIAVLALTDQALWVDRVEVEDVSCQ